MKKNVQNTCKDTSMRTYIGKMNFENIFNIINHKGNVKYNHNEIVLHSY